MKECFNVHLKSACVVLSSEDPREIWAGERRASRLHVSEVQLESCDFDVCSLEGWLWGCVLSLLILRLINDLSFTWVLWICSDSSARTRSMALYKRWSARLPTSRWAVGVQNRFCGVKLLLLWSVHGAG